MTDLKYCYSYLVTACQERKAMSPWWHSNNGLRPRT